MLVTIKGAHGMYIKTSVWVVRGGGSRGWAYGHLIKVLYLCLCPLGQEKVGLARFSDDLQQQRSAVCSGRSDILDVAIRMQFTNDCTQPQLLQTTAEDSSRHQHAPGCIPVFSMQSVD